jgi:RNA polymerase sigma-70 factor (ECF subfamily)
MKNRVLPTDLPKVPEDTASLFRRLFEHEFSYVWNTLRRLGVREADVLDQAQEVFLVVHSLLPDYDTTRPPRPWLFAIAYRIACRYRSLARHRYEVHEDLSCSAEDLAPRADQKMEADEARELMLHAIQGIDLPRRAVFIMSELEGESMADIAAALQIPVNTAYSRLRLAREDFEQAANRLLARRTRARGTP